MISDGLSQQLEGRSKNSVLLLKGRDWCSDSDGGIYSRKRLRRRGCMLDVRFITKFSWRVKLTSASKLKANRIAMNQLSLCGSQLAGPVVTHAYLDSVEFCIPRT
jgi:hypothetical protein